MSFLGLLIPPQYKLAIEIGILLLYTATVSTITYKYVNNVWIAEQAKQVKEASILKSKLEEEKSSLKDSLIKATEQVEVTRREALEKIDHLEHSLRNTIATRGLRDPGRLQSRNCKTNTVSETSVYSEEETHQELSGELSGFLLDEFTRADEVVADKEECYNRYEAVVDSVNAYADRVEGISK